MGKVKKLALLTLTLFSLSIYSQNNIGKKYYEADEISLLSIVKMIDKSGFELQKRDLSMEVFKKGVIGLGEDSIRQLNISSRVICTDEHNEKFEIWNMFYNKITREFYYENCQELIALMLLDGIIDA